MNSDDNGRKLTSRTLSNRSAADEATPEIESRRLTKTKRKKKSIQQNDVNDVLSSSDELNAEGYNKKIT